MSSLNKVEKVPLVRNHNNLLVKKQSPEAQLLRMTLANMLWEDQFYVDGQTTAALIKDLTKKVSANYIADLAQLARGKFKLRHMPLLLTRELARQKRLKARSLTDVIQRPDEMAEFLSIYWKEGRTPLANQVKKGLAEAFNKFNEYQFAKWDKNNTSISLRDVMFLTHPTPQNSEEEALFYRIANDKLETPDTWETQLSAGADKNKTFTRLMQENKLGALAFLRNLRNMVESGVSENLIREYARTLNVSKVLPFRYIAAARIVPQFEDMLEEMMLRSLASHEKLPGKTLLMVDVSGSMFGGKISRKSDLNGFDAAAALAVLAREICESVDIYTFSNSCVRVAPRRGFALVEALRNSQPNMGTYTGAALKSLRDKVYDRIIVFTDEQSHDRVDAPYNGAIGYMVNIAAYQNGVNFRDWVNISGFSEAIMDFILATEKEF